MSVYSDVRQIRAEALNLDPTKALLAIVAFPFFVIGFMWRFAWMVPAFAVTSMRFGWRRANAVIDARQAEARAG